MGRRKENSEGQISNPIANVAEAIAETLAVPLISGATDYANERKNGQEEGNQ